MTKNYKKLSEYTKECHEQVLSILEPLNKAYENCKNINNFVLNMELEKYIKGISYMHDFLSTLSNKLYIESKYYELKEETEQLIEKYKKDSE
jgi:hypothetical protein